MHFKNHDIIICITGYYLQVFKAFCKSIMNIATMKTEIYYVMHCYINCLNCVQYTQIISSTQLNIKYSTLLLILNYFFLYSIYFSKNYRHKVPIWCLILVIVWFGFCAFLNMQLFIHAVVLICLTSQYFVRKYFTCHIFHLPWYLTKDI